MELSLKQKMNDTRKRNGEPLVGLKHAGAGGTLWPPVGYFRARVVLAERLLLIDSVRIEWA